MKHVILLRLLVETEEVHANAHLEMATNKALQNAEAAYKAFGVGVVGRESSLTKPTKEEAMRLTPRRIHFGDEGHALCTASRLFPKDATTPGWERVDCKQCLKKKPASMQKELFG